MNLGADDTNYIHNNLLAQVRIQNTKLTLEYM